MTEFKHVALEVTEFPNVKLNLEKSKLWVSTDAQGWSSCLNYLQENRSQFLDKFSNRQKNQTADFLHSSLVNFLKRGEWNLVPHFFENLLAAISVESINGLSKTNSRWGLVSLPLQELFEVLLNQGCILLPLINARADDAPKWHPRAKPTRITEPYTSIIQEALETRNDKLLKGAIDTIFASICFKHPDDCTADVFSSFMASEWFTEISSNRTGNYYHLLNVIVRQSKNDIFLSRDATNSRNGYLRMGMAKNVTTHELYKSENINQLLTCLTEIDPQAAGLVKAIANWLQTITHVNIRNQVRDTIFFAEWCIEHKIFDLKNLNRSMFVRNANTPITETYFERVENSLDSEHRKSVNIRYVYEFLGAYFDNLADELGHYDYKSPISERDKMRWQERKPRGAKSNKKVLPSHVIKMAKEILLEDNYSWAKTQSMNWHNGLFVPTVPIALYTLLTLPLRTIQVRLLDTGEFDEFILDDGFNEVQNTHEGAIKNRKSGVLRSFREDFTDRGFTGFFITTNKSAADEAGRQLGYEIPYEEKTLIKELRALTEWQKSHNPITNEELLDRSQIPEKGVMIQGALSGSLPKYALLFRDIKNKYNKAFPISYSSLVSCWTSLLIEIENRLSDDGVNLKLTDGEVTARGSTKSVKPLYTLHGLRVSGITHFVEAGVPLHILAEFVAGHSNLIMTLYYTKLSNWTISEQLEQASAALDEASEDEFMKTMSNLSDTEFNNSFIGGKEATAYLPDGDKGVWGMLPDGFCVTGHTKCAEGGTEVDFETGIERTVPIVPNQFNCPLCKFYVTGTAFLTNQVAMVNTLMCVIKERASVRNEILEKLKAAKDSKNARKQKILQSDFESLELELTEKLKTLSIRMTNVFKCQELLKNQCNKNSKNTALITSMDAGELKVQLEETKQFELLEWASQSAEIFPNLPVSGAKFRKQRMLEKMAQENGLKPLFLHLSDEDAVQAGNQLTNMMTKMWGRSNVNDLLGGKQNLMQLGLMSDFENAVGEAIHSVANTAIENPNTLMIEGGENIDAAE